MKRYNLYLTSRQLEVFTDLSEKQDTSVSELIRRALDDYIHKEVREDIAAYVVSNKKRRQNDKR